ncbi:glycosyltransferase family 4 protein [Thiocapsa bogorovii]|uniref:glycosyltransferase family 4 protein n=1 Tax=Thiocapsa bogorovii TaxID=521689 RepID=UPI001E5C6829|nr:glycosyltransferase family 4 protein [Thiocapsa bogorovii]UHD15470.1 glycosyltransferase family 4 protein [Thiocapsa bogorovii]
MIAVRFFNTYEPVSPFYRDLLPFLAEQGMTAEVVVSSREYRGGRQPLEDSLRHPGLRLRRLPTGRGVVRTGPQKLWAMAGYLFGAAAYSLFGPRVRLNFFLTQPPLFALWGVVLRRLRGQRYCCLVMDLYPDVAVRDGLLSADGWLTRALTRLSRFALRRADAVVVIGRCMRDHLERDGIPADRLHLVPNWINENEVFPVPHAHNRLRRDWGLADKFVILYSGNLGISHVLDDILEAARRLRALPDLVFLFIGDGSRRREVVEWQQRYALENIRLMPFQPPERLAESLSLGDLHFISLRAGFAGLVVPSKAYGALGAGRAILYQGEPSGEIARMVAEEQIGTVIPLGDPDALTAAIRRYHADRTLAVAQGQRSLALNREKYGRDHALSRYLALFQTFADKE